VYVPALGENVGVAAVGVVVPVPPVEPPPPQAARLAIKSHKNSEPETRIPTVCSQQRLSIFIPPISKALSANTVARDCVFDALVELTIS
jgi:hypothetical protein